MLVGPASGQFQSALCLLSVVVHCDNNNTFNFNLVALEEMTKIGINGFNRTTKILLRILIEKDAKVVAINDPDVSIEEMVRMMKYDTNYGRYEEEIQVKQKSINLFIRAMKFKRALTTRSLSEAR